MQRLSTQWLIMLLIVGAACIAQQATDAWTTFTAPDKSFTVSFPGEPKLTDSKEEHAHNYIWLWAAQGERVFLAGNTDYDFRLDQEKELQLDRDNFLTQVKAKLITTKRIEFERAPNDKLQALEFTGESERFTFKGLVIVDTQRAYMFCVGGRGNIMASTERFLNSVRLFRP
jgi:hypothetical protein